MDYGQSFSVLNEKLKPRYNTSDHIYSTLNRLEDRPSRATSVYYSFVNPTLLPTTSSAAPSKVTDQTEDVPYNEVSADPPQLFEDNSTTLSEISLNDAGDEDDSSSTKSEEKDCPGELCVDRAEETFESPTTEGGSVLQKAFIDGTLPDLIRSGRPLGRRRTLGHVSDTLKEVRREVELSRKRSIRLKAQVDKLQESHEGHGWGQDRARVTEEVQSILHILHPLTEPMSRPLKTPSGENLLDAALLQLQFVARKLALDHTSQDPKPGKSNRAEETAILQQALRDRDEAIEKKKAMESELLRSKTEMMALNNQLLEAVQKRLELSLELEAWKEDVQLMIQQQLRAQQEAEQASMKNIRGLFRRNNKPPIQRPTNFPHPNTAPKTNSNTNNKPSVPSAPANTNQSLKHNPSTSGTLPRNWRLKKKFGGKEQEVDPNAQRGSDGFQVVSLD